MFAISFLKLLFKTIAIFVAIFVDLFCLSADYFFGSNFLLKNCFCCLSCMSFQQRGHCRHKKALWDNHPRCLSCAGCSRFSTCTICKLWTSLTWDFADLRCSHRKSVLSQQSSFSFSVSISEDWMKHTASHS